MVSHMNPGCALPPEGQPCRLSHAVVPCLTPVTMHAPCAQAVNTYQQLATLLRGEQPKGLLLPGPRGYVASRVRTLAGGAVVHEFQWAGGGQWAGKPWSAELPTDTALLLFLFSAFLAVAFSHYTGDLCWSNQAIHPLWCGLVVGVYRRTTYYKNRSHQTRRVSGCLQAIRPLSSCPNAWHLLTLTRRVSGCLPLADSS